jgi:hypothetical protein
MSLPRPWQVVPSHSIILMHRCFRFSSLFGTLHFWSASSVVRFVGATNHTVERQTAEFSTARPHFQSVLSRMFCKFEQSQNYLHSAKRLRRSERMDGAGVPTSRNGLTIGPNAMSSGHRTSSFPDFWHFPISHREPDGE